MKNILILFATIFSFAFMACEKSDIQPYGQIGVGVDEYGNVQVSANIGVYVNTGTQQQFYPGANAPYPIGGEIGVPYRLAAPVSVNPTTYTGFCHDYYGKPVGNGTTLNLVLVNIGGGLSRTTLPFPNVHQEVLFAQIDAGDWHRVVVTPVVVPVGDCGGSVIGLANPYYLRTTGEKVEVSYDAKTGEFTRTFQNGKTETAKIYFNAVTGESAIEEMK